MARRRSRAAKDGTGRDLNTEMRLAFEAHRNWLSLHMALNISIRTMPVPPDEAPFEETFYYVPAWVACACYDLVTSKLKTSDQKKGRHARWLTPYRDELKDQARWRVVEWCRAQGLDDEEARGAAAEYLSEAEDTIKHAIGRVENRRAQLHQHAYLDDPRGQIENFSPVFRPELYPWGPSPYDEDVGYDPELSQLWQIGDYSNLDAFMRYVSARPPSSEDDSEIRRARRLLEIVQDIRTRKSCQRTSRRRKK